MIAAQYPAKHYVMIDDKLLILAAMKALWDDKITTIFSREGIMPMTQNTQAFAPADLTIDHIGQLINFDMSQGLYTT